MTKRNSLSGHPISIEWSSKNTIDIQSITAGSGKKVWWICDKGHQWEATPKNRISRGSGCPYCSGRRATEKNSVRTKLPQFTEALLRSGGGDPDKITFTSRKKFTLACESGHTWEASPHEYCGVKGDVCPYCSRRQLLEGVSDLATVYPEVARFWDSDANGCLPTQLLGSKNNNLFYFICDHGHKWSRNIDTMIKHPSCPVCTGKRIEIGFNDISVFAPELLEELDDSFKTEEQILRIFPTSSYKMTWNCPEGHTYRASMGKRTSGQGCPYCSGNRITPGKTDLASTHPEIAAQWDYEKNTLFPEEVSHGSTREKVWWKCALGHSYQATPAKRTDGTGCPYCANKRILPGFNDLATANPDILELWDYEKNHPLTPKDVVSGSGKRAWWICEKGHSWKTTIYNVVISGNRCGRCSWGESAGELEVREFVESLLPDTTVEASIRSIISPQELDIYIPSLKIAIEYNGLYWHSEANGKDRQYHRDKWQKCKDQGIQLITIWEDQWRDNQDLVKNMLAHKLGVTQGPRVFARKTTVIEVDNRTAREFCDTYHIQGFAPGSAYLGLEDSSTGELVALSIWRKNKTDLYLDRYCTSASVIGGMGKLLKAGKRFARENNLSQIITFADHDVSDGGLYEKLGFTHDGELNPDYKYLVNGERKHKFGYRLKRFRSDPGLLYEPGMTETQLAKLNGLHRIWDSGKTRYTMEP